MPGLSKIYLDTFCEVHDLLKPYSAGEFWEFADITPEDGAVYLVGRAQFNKHLSLIKRLAIEGHCYIILSNPFEGSETIKTHCELAEVDMLIKSGRIWVIGGGNMSPEWPCLSYDSFATKIFTPPQNIAAAFRSDEIYAKHSKPYQFLCLNGRVRLHRKQLLDQLVAKDLLQASLWTTLDAGFGQIQYLPKHYEVTRYQDKVGVDSESFAKYQLFNNEWGDIYLNPDAYIDTYFSIVTETVFDYPYSFRTEKIWKPVAMAHPWIAVANRGFYRDMHNLGFQTFGHVIDESFDQIDNNQDRLTRIVTVVDDLCRRDLASFLKECYNVCKYNQQHLALIAPVIQSEFPDRFFKFLTHNINERSRIQTLNP
jgi:hypothetical protein